MVDKYYKMPDYVSYISLICLFSARLNGKDRECIRETKKEKSKPATKNFSAIIPPETLHALKSLAEEEHRSVNGQLVYIVEKYLKETGRLS